MSKDETYCEICNTNYGEQDPNGFDYRFDTPVCFDCVEKYQLDPNESDDYDE